jgi:hypothetical protein
MAAPQRLTVDILNLTVLKHSAWSLRYITTFLIAAHAYSTGSSNLFLTPCDPHAGLQRATQNQALSAALGLNLLAGCLKGPTIEAFIARLQPPGALTV